MKLASFEEVKNLLRYEPDTGNLYWLPRKFLACEILSNPAGHVDNQGHIRIKLLGRKYLAHRLAWLLMTGEWPEIEVDHANNVRTDNRWENLRAATKLQNAGNRLLNRNNKSGYKGVYFCKVTQKWKAALGKGFIGVHLGCFDDPVSAANAYDAAAINRYGQYARTNFGANGVRR